MLYLPNTKYHGKWMDEGSTVNAAQYQYLCAADCKVNLLFFADDCSKLWNCLPKHVKGASTLAAFKGSLGDFLNQIPDMPPSTGYNGVNHNSILDWAKQNNII